MGPVQGLTLPPGFAVSVVLLLLVAAGIGSIGARLGETSTRRAGTSGR